MLYSLIGRTFYVKYIRHTDFLKWTKCFCYIPTVFLEAPDNSHDIYISFMSFHAAQIEFKPLRT